MTRWIRCTLAVVVLGAALVPSSTPAPSDPRHLPTYNHDVLGTRHNPAERTLGKENAGQLVEKWRFPAQDSELQIGVIHATPAVVVGSVYFGTVALDPTFYKLTPDGKVCWSYRN